MTDKRPPSVFGIIEADLVQWKHNPVSKVVFQFISDFQQALKRERDLVLDSSSTAPDSYVLGEYKGRVGAYQDIFDINFSAMSLFYEDPEKEETGDNKNAAKAAEG